MPNAITQLLRMTDSLLLRLSQSLSHDFLWGFCPFQFFIVPIYRVITKTISESTCGKSTYYSTPCTNNIHLEIDNTQLQCSSVWPGTGSCTATNYRIVQNSLMNYSNVLCCIGEP